MTSYKGDNEQNFDIVEPYAPAMLESLRAIGYNIQTAIADLIDNSITAEAKNIWLTFFWDGPTSYIAIKDDGAGMSEADLINAMRPGSRNPLETRSANDLGRFGMGLKTASLSQCKRFTVRSKIADMPSATRCWDLAYVEATGEWRLLRTASEEASGKLAEFDQNRAGTIVLWEILDRVVGDGGKDNTRAHDHFLKEIETVEQHLSMVFHRFIEMPQKLNIFINNRLIKPWDPFLRDEVSTQFLPEENFYDSGGQITVQPYILPHHTKITQQRNDDAAGLNGWISQQGFYIYRNNRLLVDGNWLGLGFRKAEHYRLARIQVDLPNSLDATWKIDVKKSKARPPNALNADFKRIASLTRTKALEVYRHRGGSVLAGRKSESLLPWQRKIRHGKVFYAVDRQHPLVQEALKATQNEKSLNALLRFLEETVPVQQIWLDSASNPDDQTASFEDVPSEEVMSIMSEVYQSLRSSGLTHEAAQLRLGTMEPFRKSMSLFMEFFRGEGEKA